MPSSRTLGSGWQQSSISSWNLPWEGGREHEGPGMT